MKKIIVFIAAFLLLLLDWAALHDILAGEPDVYGEYLVLGFSIIIFTLAFIFRKKLNFNK